MNIRDLEKKLVGAKFHHLTGDELDSYYDRKLDSISRARVEAHLTLCLICDRRLELIKEESEALDNQQAEFEDVELVRQVFQTMELKRLSADLMPAENPARPSLPDLLAEYLSQLVASWQAHFKKPAAERSAEKGEEVWRWQSEDGVLKARAVLKKDVNLTIHFSSNRMDWEGAHLNVRLGQVSRETTLRRVSDDEVYARVKLPRRQLPKKITDLSIG
jgi:hypothetical protein